MEELIQRFEENKRRVFIGGGSVLAGVAILIGYFQSGPDAMSYARAEAAVHKWEKSPENEQLYRGMQQAVSEVPQLKKKYEALIAQKLIDMDRLDEAMVLAHRALDRVAGEVPFHSAFAKTSLLIQQGQYQRALEEAVSLKEKMGDGSLKAGALLYAYNLLRIAALQQALSNAPGEKAGWEELEAYLAKRTDLTEVFTDNFSGGSLTLSQYIAERKKGL